MKPKRPLTREDSDLWSAVTRGIEPYHHAAIAPAAPHSTGVSKDRAVTPRTQSRKPDALSARPPATQAGDPRLDRRAARGRMAIDAVLDLHGHNQAAAHMALQRFLAQAKAQRHRCLLVITGKGATSSGSGILKRRFLEWIDERDMREHVSRVAPAHQRHGGAGAFYVFMKSPNVKRPSR